MTQQTDHDLLIEINTTVKTMAERMATYVTKDEFLPVKCIAYGLAGLILLGVGTAILNKTVGAQNESIISSSPN